MCKVFKRRKDMSYRERNCGTFTFDICDEIYCSKLKLQMHTAMHSEQCKCDKCSKCFSKKQGLQRHTHVYGCTSSFVYSRYGLNFSLKHNLKRQVSNQNDK